MEDLWPDTFGTSEVVPPVRVLREQAKLLESKTSGLVQGWVQTRKEAPAPFELSNSSMSEVKRLTRFRHTLYFRVPLLDDYDYVVLAIEHKIELYPAVGYSYVHNEKFECANLEDYRNILKRIFASEEVKRVIQALMVQVLDLEDEKQGIATSG